VKNDFRSKSASKRVLEDAKLGKFDVFDEKSLRDQKLEDLDADAKTSLVKLSAERKAAWAIGNYVQFARAQFAGKTTDTERGKAFSKVLDLLTAKKNDWKIPEEPYKSIWETGWNNVVEAIKDELLMNLQGNQYWFPNSDWNALEYPQGISIDPIAGVVAVTKTTTFKVTGGTGQIKFTMMNDTSGGATIHASTGLYTAGPNAGRSTVGVADEAGNTAVAKVTVNPALAIAPTTQNVTHGGTVQFNATGGVEPRKYSFSDNQSIGATIDESTGLYKAGSAGGKTDKVKVTDSSIPPVSQEATVNVQ
ncbi:MAG: hypothetical protein KGJ48_17735, partial [Nitrospirota bacterium]|nr:hypothetical protein [Nitrospirota bacterium]